MRQHRTFKYLATHQPDGRSAHELELGNGRLADARHFGQQRLGGVHDLGERAEPREQRLG